MKYDELRKLATQYPFRIDQGCRNLIVVTIPEEMMEHIVVDGAIGNGLKGRNTGGIGSTYKYIYGDDIERAEEAAANAALMVHCTNKFEGLMQILHHLLYSDTVCRSDYKEAEEVFKDAQEVEGI